MTYRSKLWNDVHTLVIKNGVLNMLVHTDFCDLFFFTLLIISLNFPISLACRPLEKIEPLYIVLYNYHFTALYRKRVSYSVALNLPRTSDMYLKRPCILSSPGVRRNKISIFIPCVLFPVNSPILVLHYC